MPIDVTLAVRHAELPEALQERALAVAAQLEKYEDRLARVDLVFDEEAEYRKRGKAICHVHGGTNVVAEAEGEGWRPCIERLKNRVRRELRKQRERHREHQAPDLTRVHARQRRRAAG